MQNFCTITTASYLFKSFALADSLNSIGAQLHILVVDSYEEISAPGNVIIYPLSFVNDETAKLLIQKYRKSSDKLRWSMKPVFMKQLLSAYDKLIYVDNDIYFFNQADFLFAELDSSRVLLTPHFYPSNPTKEQNWLEANFRVGLYNAGFFAARNDAGEILDWWAQCCLYNIKKSYWRGLFDDQKYLDLIPVKFDNVKVLKHYGCNLAGWNYKTYNLTQDKQQVLVNANPVVFIHFTRLTLKEFSQTDNLFYAYYLKYMESLNIYNPSYSPLRPEWKLYHLNAYIYYIKWQFLRLFNK